LKAVHIVVVAALALGGCAKSPRFDPALVSAAQLREGLPDPQLGDQLGGSRVLRLAPLDKISVRVFGVPDLDREIQIDSTGTVQLPLIGSVDAKDETPASLGTKIADLYGRRYLRNPQVSVSVVEAVKQVVVVEGAVKVPGEYPVRANSTLLSAVATAQGLAENARRDEVLLYRTINGTPMVARYDITQIRLGQLADPAVFKDDTIVVGTGVTPLLPRDLLLLTTVLGAFAPLANNN
jgi:polysaccharide export outer membrane protein